MSYSNFTELFCEVNIAIISNLSSINKMQICYNVTLYFSVHKLDSRQHRWAELKVLPVWNDLEQWGDLTFSINSIKEKGKKVEKYTLAEIIRVWKDHRESAGWSREEMIVFIHFAKGLSQNSKNILDYFIKHELRGPTMARCPQEAENLHLFTP